MSKPQSYEEAQENLSKAFKELGQLNKQFKITPLVLGITKKANWVERKIAIFRFKHKLKKASRK